DSITIPGIGVDPATGTTSGAPKWDHPLRAHASAGKEGCMHFSIGQRVVCVDANFSHEPVWRSCVRAFPRRNSIYLIRDIRKVHELVGLCFEEIVNASADFAEGTSRPPSTADASGPFAPRTSKCSRRS